MLGEQLPETGPHRGMVVYDQQACGHERAGARLSSLRYRGGDASPPPARRSDALELIETPLAGAGKRRPRRTADAVVRAKPADTLPESVDESRTGRSSAPPIAGS